MLKHQRIKKTKTIPANEQARFEEIAPRLGCDVHELTFDEKLRLLTKSPYKRKKGKLNGLRVISLRH